MSYEVDTATVQQYSTNVELLLQQKGSRLRDKVMVSSYTGKAAKAVEQIGKVTAQKALNRHADTPLISTPHDARWLFPEDYDWADLIDDNDKLRMLIDPTSSYALNGAYALGRAIDQEIIAAFFGDSKTGENGTTTTSFDTSNQQVAVTVGASGADGLNVEKLREAKRILGAAEVDTDNDPLFCAITAKQEHDLLAQTQVTSLDYNSRPVLVDGKLTSFMGFNFVRTELLGVDGSSYRRCPVWAKSGMHLGMWNDIMVSVDRRADKRNSTQVYCKTTIGATRTDEGKVVEVLCDET